VVLQKKNKKNKNSAIVGFEQLKLVFSSNAHAGLQQKEIRMLPPKKHRTAAGLHVSFSLTHLLVSP
jgi:hypothetical protein